MQEKEEAQGQAPRSRRRQEAAQLYNGFPASDVTPRGTAHDAIDKQGKGLAGRGVLLDLARLRDVPWLAGGHVITPAELDAASAAQGVEVGAGDILMFRTGWRRLLVEQGDREEFMGAEPGLGIACCEWLASAMWPRCAPTTGRSRCSRARTRR